MSNNIFTNYNLEQYNKKYRHVRTKLLKFTKKEVEDFDKHNPTKIKYFLLKNRKWVLINDTYYEIPKAPRYAWFRNLNAGIQAGCCLLGAGVVATAITVPLVLTNQNKVVTPSVKISGASYDESASHIELHKESTIILKTTDKEITGIESVKVGDKTLTHDDYSFSLLNKKVVIKAEAMTSTNIEIKVKTDEHKQPSIALDTTSIEISVESDPAQVKATLSDKAESKNIKASSSDETIATVDKIDANTFEINGVDTGNATITFACDGYTSATCKVKVNPKQETNKEKFVRLYNKYNTEYQKSAKVYTTNEIKEIYAFDETFKLDEYGGVIATIGSESGRKTEVQWGWGECSFAIDTNSNKNYLDLLKDDETLYNFEKDGTIKYIDDGATSGELQNLSVNTYGYVIQKNIVDDDDNNYKIDPSSAPVEKSVILNKTSASITQYKAAKVKATLNDGATGETVNCKSSDENIATVVGKDNNFTIRGISSGKATITFNCDGYKSVTFSVEVKSDESIQVLNKTDWLKYVDEYNKVFQNATKRYKKDKLSDLTVSYDGYEETLTINSIKYYEAEAENPRSCYVNNYYSIAGDEYYTAESLEKSTDDDGKFYISMKDGTIGYYSKTEGYSGYTDIEINEFGYLVNSSYSDEDGDYGMSITYKGEPEEFEEKTLFVKYSDDFKALLAKNNINIDYFSDSINNKSNPDIRINASHDIKYGETLIIYADLVILNGEGTVVQELRDTRIMSRYNGGGNDIEFTAFDEVADKSTITLDVMK